MIADQCRLACLVVALLGGSVAGQEAETVVTGRVTTEDGAPIAGARVTIRVWSEEDRRSAETTTGADGRYELVAYPVNSRVFVMADGYAAMYRTHEVGQGLNRGWDFPLPRSTRLSGRVVDTKGHAQSGRELELNVVRRTPPPAPGLEFWATGGSGALQTADDGTFTIPNASPGKYSIVVYRPSQGGDRNMQQVPIEGRIVELEPGRAIDDFTIRVNPPEDFVISGQVVNAGGRPYPGISVDTYIPHGRHWWRTTASDGKFYLDGLDGIGISKFRVYFNGVPGAEDFALALHDVPLNTRGITLRVPASGNVHGRIVAPNDSERVDNCVVSVPRVVLPDSGAIWENPPADCKVEGGNLFRISGVPIGVATVEIRSGEFGVQRFEAPVLPGADSAEPSEFKLLGRAIIEGQTTLDGKPKKTTIVIGDDWLSSDDAGNYRFDSYPNGPLTLWFFGADGWHRTATVNLASGETVRQDMEMGGPAEIRGTIHLSEDASMYTIRLAALPAPDGWLEVGRPAPEEQVLAYAHIDGPGGEYSLGRIPMGKWHLMVGRYEPSMHRSVLVESRVIEITEAGPVTVDFDFVEKLTAG
jgi:hypothetical protein